MRPLFFINRYFWPDDSATAQLLADLARDQVARGRAVTILTSRQLYRDAQAGLPATATWKGVAIHRLWSTSFGRDRLLGRAIDYLSFYLSVFAHLLVRLPARSILVTLTDPPLLTVVTWLPCALKSVRQAHWSQDVFPEILTALKRPSAPVRGGLGLLRWLRDRSLTGVRLAAISADMKQFFVQRGIPDEQIAILPNWSSSEDVFPVSPEENPLRREWGLEEHFVLGYSGNLGRVHDYHTFLAAAEALITEIPEIRFLFVGSGALQAKLREEMSAAVAAHAVFKPYQDRRLLSQSLSVPDVHWLSLEPACAALVFPSKLYGILAAGRPALFVGSPASDLARELREHGLGSAVSPGAKEDFAAAVVEFHQDRAARARTATRAAEYFKAHCDHTHALDRWDVFLRGLQPVATAHE